MSVLQAEIKVSMECMDMDLTIWEEWAMVMMENSLSVVEEAEVVEEGEEKMVEKVEEVEMEVVEDINIM